MLERVNGCGGERPTSEDVMWLPREYARADGVQFATKRFQQTKSRASSPVGGTAKRCFDVVLLLLLLPLVAIVALPVTCLVALGGGSTIYGHTRVGWNGRLFRCYKFRTMSVAADDELRALLEQDSTARQEWLSRFKLENDPRVTPLGRWLRKTYLDELPQIWNVLCGDMSFVGPRPVISDEMDKYRLGLPAYLACRPGITGLWQINRSSETTYDQRVAFDVEYARKWSLRRDVLILFLTIPRLLLQETRS